MGILISFKGSHSDAENLTALLAQLPTLNSGEIARMVTFGLGSVPVSDVAEALATLFNPMQLGALRERELVQS
jgi:hypothetical protein